MTAQSSNSVGYWLCDFGQATECLWAYFPLYKMGLIRPHLTGLCLEMWVPSIVPYVYQVFGKWETLRSGCNFWLVLYLIPGQLPLSSCLYSQILYPSPSMVVGICFVCLFFFFQSALVTEKALSSFDLDVRTKAFDYIIYALRSLPQVLLWTFQTELVQIWQE